MIADFILTKHYARTMKLLHVIRIKQYHRGKLACCFLEKEDNNFE